MAGGTFSATIACASLLRCHSSAVSRGPWRYFFLATAPSAPDAACARQRAHAPRRAHHANDHQPALHQPRRAGPPPLAAAPAALRALLNAVHRLEGQHPHRFRPTTVRTRTTRGHRASRLAAQRGMEQRADAGRKGPHQGSERLASPAAAMASSLVNAARDLGELKV